jgi:hypothetical protein
MILRLPMMARRRGPMPRNSGETEVIMKASKPEIPMYQRGKNQTTTPKLVSVVQKMN